VSRPLDACDGRRLIELARLAIRDRLHPEGGLDNALGASAAIDGLSEPRGAFVTLWHRDANGAKKLRGCIGRIESPQPLFRTVAEAATQSAFEDPRFEPLTAEELETVEIEVSALTPLAPIEDPQQIEIGRHGVELRCARGGAVFLPQVAHEHGWDRQALLKQLSRKAGLAETAWREGRLRIFEAEVFHECGRSPA